MSLPVRTLTAALIGAALGVVALAGAYLRAPGLTFGMDGPLPPFVTGIYNGERDGDTTFAWTSDHVAINPNDLDRHRAWTCSMRFRGPRPEGAASPTVTVMVDERRVASVAAAPDFHDLGFTLPAGARGTRIAIDVAPAFTPGGADRRVLGVQVDELSCRPTSMAWPPRWPLMQAAATSAVVAAALVLSGLSLTAGLASAAIVAVVAAFLVTIGGAVYGGYTDTVLRIAVWVMLVCAVVLSLFEKAGGRRLSPAARAVFAVSSIALLLKLAALMHPGKAVIDAMFHAHRLERVVSGDYRFFQPFVGGVQMPYAIGLYVFAWPWTWVVTDHVALIRTVTATFDVLAGALLYPVIVRAWGDRRAAALAVLFYNLAPQTYDLLRDANLTNMFGQSVALVAIAAAVSWSLSVKRPWSMLALAGLVAWAFCSHVGTLTMLPAVLGVLVLLYLWRGDTTTRSAAVGIVVAVAIALALSWWIYYRHVSEEIIAAFTRMFSSGDATTAATPAEAARGYLDRTRRLQDLLSRSLGSFGWPLVVLALVGVWSLWQRRTRDRLVSALLAWAVMFVVFSASTVFSKVDAAFVRYTVEFLGRINLAVLPMVAILAARGASAGWLDETPAGSRSVLRAVSIVLIALAGLAGARSLLGWF